VRYVEEGELFAVYLGHSNASGLWSNGASFMNREAWSALKIARGAGVFFTCGCFACELRQDSDGYGLAAMRNPTGPVAVIGAEGESYSAMGQLALDGLLRIFSQPPTPTRLADYWLAVQIGLARGEIAPMMFYLYDQADGSKGKIPLAVQRQEHLEMWLLLGDPALRLPVSPLEIHLAVEGGLTPGQRFKVVGTTPDRVAGGTVRVTLERPLGSTPADLEKLPDAPGEARDQTMVRNHERANNFVLLSAETRLTGNRFECPITAPSKLPWTNVVLRAYASTETEEALGVITLPASH
jgi:hypothetical protein